MSGSLRIALLASSRNPIREPFAGGMEAFIARLAAALSELGHRVTLFAAPGSSSSLAVDTRPMRVFEISELARREVAQPEWFVQETHAYLAVMVDLADALHGAFDVVHNHSLHYLPLAMARTVGAPMLTTLHTPPLPWLEQAMALPGGTASSFTAVSAYTARQWQHVAGSVEVVRNGVDLQRWRPGPGGDYAVWSGRIVPEKGLPMAIAAAARAGLPLRIAGPVQDRRYFDAEVAPLLGATASYEGHLCQPELNELVGGAAVALVTPAWEEPYGLVTAEALASGTPVAAFARGGVPEILDQRCGRLAPIDDVEALAEATVAAAALSREDARRRAETHCCDQTMLRRYLETYRRLVTARAAKMPA